MSSTDTRPTVTVLGGGYSGIKVAKALDDVADVTLVAPADAFTHNSAAWRALVEPEWLDRIFLPYDRLLTRGRFVHDRATAVDGRRVTLASGQVLEPDHLVLATGSGYPFPAKVDERNADTARARFQQAHQELRDAKRVLVIGAGPAGLELAGEIRAFFPDKTVTIVGADSDVMPGPFDQDLRDELRRQLDELGVELRLGTPIRDLPAVPPTTVGDVVVTTAEGEKLTADVWYQAFGVTPATGYLRGDLAAARHPNGLVRVDDQLRVAGAEGVYAVGDITDADRDGIGTASAQADLVAANLRARITGEGEVRSYVPGPMAIAVPLGPDGGAGQLPGLDGVAGAEMIAGLKGKTMLVEPWAALFDAA
ncbi:NADH dehydrogenase, FAD-containing subunit [Asanoa hainanensis]|uniref:NADH dehydrogenase, FAD-containing subunit n=1 Tax=Asanoa hainanensis TaxID=560556 RepID=A0A239LCT9_9ACTN|nr:FAD-dependent oxidoreductase [Asanoa hainanensis]SNT28115.1 NADH dehydrogenase, FAD-containing subunit [Asanoa hainanensis]